MLKTMPDGAAARTPEVRDVRDDADRTEREQRIEREDRDQRVGRADGERSEMHARMRRAGSPAHGGVAPSWQDIKSRFVDDPSGAIAEAEGLVRRAVDDKVRALHAEAEALCAHDGAGEAANDTEAMRARLLRYQAYFERLAGISASGG